jgi:polysaccharide export outer membrane protein
MPLNSFAAYVLIGVVSAASASAQVPASPAARGASLSEAAASLPRGYTIGADDRLSITFWGDKDLNAEVIVRPDGKISLPLLNDVDAAGLTPDELRERLVAAAKRFVEAPAPTVVVKEINSRRVFITGNVEKPGLYELNAPMTVLQLIATAGGLRDFVSGKNIVVVRTSSAKPGRFKFNYQDVIAGKKLGQNIALEPGDTVIVP